MFGPGWVWTVLGTVVLIAAVAALKLLATAASHIGETGETADPLADDLWHRHEGGDLTREEFERAIRKRRKEAA